MSETIKNKVDNGACRIAYVEPNDIYGTVDGVPMTPDYVDYCISFNLIAEFSTRYKPSLDTHKASDPSEGKTFQISGKGWLGNPHDYVQTLEGGEKNDYGNYLTTYYSEISYDDLKDRQIIEGLGVENITVAFENYYTPTVTIKFIDVRGSGIFGNEENAHTGNKITSDTVFGVFFTFPYPRFKLQIKGFYGRAVTYQLICSGFKSSFNSQTGNFEAIAKFIGFSYSLLTDIPFMYLVAAPECEYKGKAYWEEHCETDPTWLLSDGDKPRKLSDIYDDIKSMRDNGVKMASAVTEEESEKLRQANNEREILNEIGSKYSSFISALHGLGGCDKFIYDTSNSDKCQMLLTFSNNTIRVTDEVRVAYNDLLSYFNKYNETYTDSKLSVDILPNHRTEEIPNDYNFVGVDTFHTHKDSSNKTEVTYLLTDKHTSEGLQEFELNDGRKLIPEVADMVYKQSSGANPSDNIGQYAYIVDLYEFSKVLYDRRSMLDGQVNEIKRRVNESHLADAEANLNFKPFIGNIFKIIMCHLETFIHIMIQCFDVVSTDAARNRTPSRLNIDLGNTDAEGLSTAPPWLYVYNIGKETSNGGDSDSTVQTIAWVGDYSSNFEEEKVVRGLLRSIQKLKKQMNENPSIPTSIDYIPVLPCDINNHDNCFANTRDTSLSALSGYLGMRTAAIFGILNKDGGNCSNDEAEMLGKIDAYNWYLKVMSKDVLKTQLVDQSGSNSLGDIFYGISKTDSAYDTYATTSSDKKSYHCFETVLNAISSKKGRHPIYSELSNNNTKLLYSHYYTKYPYSDSDSTTGTSLIPAKLLEFSEYNTVFDYTNERGGFATFDVINKENRPPVLHKGNTKAFYNNDTSTHEDYLNDYMFNVFTVDEEVTAVIDRYNSMKSGSVSINGEQFSDDFSKITSKYWKVEKEDYGKYFSGVGDMFHQSYGDNGIKESQLFPIENNSDNTAPDSFGKFWYSDVISKPCKYNQDDDNWRNHKGNSVSKDGLFIHNLECCVTTRSEKGGTGMVRYSLFGHRFYYMQNTISDEATREKSKCLLFLTSLKYNYSSLLAPFLDANKKNGGIYVMPYGYLLLLGGMLWRKRQMRNTGKDPIVHADSSLKYTNMTDSENESSFIYNNSTWISMCPVMEGLSKTHPNSIPNNKFFWNGSTINLNYEPDYYISNKLIELFENYVNGDWVKIRNKLELYRVVDGQKMAYNSKTFEQDIVQFKEDMNSGTDTVWEKLKEQTYFVGFIGTYRYVYNATIGNNQALLFLLAETSDIQNMLRDVYTKKVIISDTSGVRHTYNANSYDGTNGGAWVQPSVAEVKSYMKGFGEKISSIIGGDTDSDLEKRSSDRQRDLLIQTYMYLKRLWDNWLNGSRYLENGKHEYDVQNFFGNFIFIDSFYRNIFAKLVINCDTFMKIFEERNEETSVFSVIADLTKQHKCLFVGLPDYVDIGNKDINTAVKEMESIFTPIPYIKMNDVQRDNKFVVIYVPKPSAIATNMNGYRKDSFDIWSTEKETDEAPDVFKIPATSDTESDEITRYGYNVPSFGIAFSRQNNHIFKDIRLNMDTPIVTSASISASAYIAGKGASNAHKVSFVGQDLYPVFANYSYICEVEMMGDAQIQPLMYFQLMNIPMFKGTYMIFNVTHVMTPGNMVTRFKGMKISQYTVPYSTEWYTVNEIEDEANTEDTGTVGGGTQIDLKSDYDKVETPADNTHFYQPYNHHSSRGTVVYKGDGSTKSKGGLLDDKLPFLYNQLYEEIAKLPENKDKPTWNVYITDVNAGGHVTGSQHYKGEAMDLKIMLYGKNGDTTKPAHYRAGSGEKPDPNYFKVFDILLKNHRSDLHQVLFEYYSSSDAASSSKCYIPRCIHVGIKSSDKQNTQFYLDNGKFSPLAFNKIKDTNIPEFKQIAYYYYSGARSNFREVFRNFAGASNEQIEQYFNGMSASEFSTTPELPVNASGDLYSQLSWARQLLKSELSIMDSAVAGIFGNFMQESQMKATAQQSSGGGEGLAQWTYGPGKVIVKNWYKSKTGNTVSKITQIPFEWQMRFLVADIKENLIDNRKKLLKGMQNSNSSVDTMTKLFMDEYEKPGKPELKKRIGYAKTFMKDIQSGKIG